MVNSAVMVYEKLISKSTLQRLRAAHWRKRLIVMVAAVLAIEGSVLASIIHQKDVAERALAKERILAVKEAKFIASKREVLSVKKLPARTTFSGFLADQGMEPNTIQEVIQDTRPVYNLASVRAGNEVTLITSQQGALREVGYEIDPEHVLWIRKQSSGFDATVQQIPFVLKVAEVSGAVHSSLFTAIENQGEHDPLAIEFADIFAWDFDFNTDTQDGDRFEVVVQKKFLNGQFAGYGNILAAEYDSGGHRYQALRFRDPSGQPAYYAPDGKAVKKAFLRSPLRFAARITSRFSYHRFHPILKRYMPHLGIDYGAPMGSKVQAVGDGKVIFAGWDRGGGREVKLRHANGYETFYLHLSRILVHVGQHVQQGQIIALTGESGLATGPHLDFRIMIHGKFRNFLALKLPPARSVARKDWPDFEKVRSQMLSELASLRSHPGRVEQASLHSSAPSASATLR
ncbi:MAG: peptidoglycan DD-metalloendopeptidase family protein [Acidobacteriota bacterium]